MPDASAILDLDETGDAARALRSTNPFLWQAHELILHPNKLQWRVRQTRAHATLKLMVRRVCYARGQRSALQGQAEVAELERIAGRAPPSREVCRKDPRFMAFLSVNHFSRAPLLGTSDLVPFTNEEFAEYISMYTGTPSPATSSFVGAPIRRGNNTNFHTTADAAGLNLAKAALGRDGLRTIFHNRMQDAFVAEADLTGIRVRTRQVLDADVAIRASGWEHGRVPGGSATQQKIHPDLVLRFSSSGRLPARLTKALATPPPPGGLRMLGDVKTVSLTADSPYLTQEPFDQQWTRILDKSPSVAVERRAGSVAQEYRSLAKACDEGRFVEAGSGLPGPFTKAIALFGETLGFAVGLFAECSELWDVFAHIFADERAASAKRNSGTVTDCQQLRVRYYHHIIEHWGSLAAREQVRLRLAVARDLAGPTIAQSKSLWQRKQDFSAQRLIEQGYFSRPYSGRGFIDEA